MEEGEKRSKRKQEKRNCENERSETYLFRDLSLTATILHLDVFTLNHVSHCLSFHQAIFSRTCILLLSALALLNTFCCHHWSHFSSFPFFPVALSDRFVHSSSPLSDFHFDSGFLLLFIFSFLTVTCPSALPLLSHDIFVSEVIAFDFLLLNSPFCPPPSPTLTEIFAKQSVAVSRPNRILCYPTNAVVPRLKIVPILP